MLQICNRWPAPRWPGVDLGAPCLGVVAGAAAATLWTFVPSLRPRLRGVLSNATREGEAELMELRPSILTWRQASRMCGPCWDGGGRKADRVLARDLVAGWISIWRMKISSGWFPGPRSTAKGGYP